MKQKTLALFFTRGMSLKQWEQCGIIDREVAIYNALSPFFQKIYFITYGDCGELQYQKYLARNIEIIPNKWKINASFYSFLAPIMLTKQLAQADFYKTDQMDGAWTALIAKLLYRKKLIVRTGYTWSRFIMRDKLITRLIVSLIEKTTYFFCHAAIVSSVSDEKYLINKYGFLKNKITVIPNYIDTEIFRPISAAKYENRILYVGRLVKQKNLLNLISALKGMNCALDIVGGGELKNEIVEIAKKNKVKVDFLGMVANHELPRLINKYRIFVLPSLFEGMPKSLLEAMSCGLACVGTRVAGTCEVIADGVNGLLTNTDERSLRKTIVRLINDQELQKKLGEASRRLILEKYSLKNNIHQEIKIYDSFKK